MMLNKLVNVAIGLPRFNSSFEILDVHKLVVHQVETDDGHDLQDAFLVVFNTLGSALGGGASADLSTMF